MSAENIDITKCTDGDKSFIKLKKIKEIEIFLKKKIENNDRARDEKRAM